MKYQAEEVRYRIRVDPEKLPQRLKVDPVLATMESVQQLFTILLESCKNTCRTTDFIRLCIHSRSLDKPISTTLMAVSLLTVEKIVTMVMKVLQSKEELHLDDGFAVDVLIIHRDSGAGRQRVINIDVDRFRKKSILAIPTDDKNGLCCAMAILFALAHVDRDKQAINRLRNHNRMTLKNEARDLHRDAGVPLGPCTYAEIETFERHLDIQVVVISSQNLNKVSYKGRKKSRRVNLWLHNGHFDVITNLKGFYGSQFYCEECEKPYHNLEEHICPESCAICRKRDCTPDDPIRCHNCFRLCRSEKCYNEHKK